MIWNHRYAQDPNFIPLPLLRTLPSRWCTPVSILLPLDITACPLFPFFSGLNMLGKKIVE